MPENAMTAASGIAVAAIPVSHLLGRKLNYGNEMALCAADQ